MGRTVSMVERNSDFCRRFDLPLLTSSITEFVSTSLDEGLPYSSSNDTFSASPTQQYEGGELHRNKGETESKRRISSYAKNTYKSRRIESAGPRGGSLPP